MVAVVGYGPSSTHSYQIHNDSGWELYATTSPTTIEIHDTQAEEKWKGFRRACETEKTEAVQVTTLLTVIGEEARKVYSTFSGWRG